jgi:hypothetical protein
VSSMLQIRRHEYSVDLNMNIVICNLSFYGIDITTVSLFADS